MRKSSQIEQGCFGAGLILRVLLILIAQLAFTLASFAAEPLTIQSVEMTPRKMIEAQIPNGKSIDSVSKEDYLTAVCAAVKKFRPSAPQIAGAAVKMHPDWKKEILTTSFHCLGNGDCALLAQIFHVISPTRGAATRDLIKLAIELAPDCGSGRGGSDGNFGNPPGVK